MDQDIVYTVEAAVVSVSVLLRQHADDFYQKSLQLNEVCESGGYEDFIPIEQYDPWLSSL